MEFVVTEPSRVLEPRDQLLSRRWAVVVLYLSTAATVTVQRGLLYSTHTTFKIFRESFWHLLAGLNLYAHYPAEQGGAPADLFKYSPTAALLYAPFAVLPYWLALFAWSALGALLLFHALRRLLPPGQAIAAAVLVYPELLVSMQACSSNALVAALIVLAYVYLENGRRVRGAVAVIVGAAVKIFPLAAVIFALFHPRRRRFAFVFAGVAVLALLLPLLATSPDGLARQYHWWTVIERSDAADIVFGLSAMRLLRDWTGGSWPNWPMQLAGTVALLVPLLVAHRRGHWGDAAFRLQFLASVLAYVVLFNHQAEHASFVIGGVGVAIWCVSPPPGATRHVPRLLLGILALLGLDTIPLLLVWIAMQVELYRWQPAPQGHPITVEPGAQPEYFGAVGASAYSEILSLTGEHERPALP